MSASAAHDQKLSLMFSLQVLKETPLSDIYQSQRDVSLLQTCLLEVTLKSTYLFS